MKCFLLLVYIYLLGEPQQLGIALGSPSYAVWQEFSHFVLIVINFKGTRQSVCFPQLDEIADAV